MKTKITIFAFWAFLFCACSKDQASFNGVWIGREVVVSECDESNRDYEGRYPINNTECKKGNLIELCSAKFEFTTDFKFTYEAVFYDDGANTVSKIEGTYALTDDKVVLSVQSDDDEYTYRIKGKTMELETFDDCLMTFILDKE